MSELRAALSAGDPLAGRRRRSSTITPMPTEEISKQRYPQTPVRSRLVGMWERLRSAGGGETTGKGDNGKCDTTGNSPSASRQGSAHREDSGSSAFLPATTRRRSGSVSLRAAPTEVPPRRAFPFPGGNSGGGLVDPSEKEAISEPRRASLEGSANRTNGDGITRLELARQQNPRYSFKRLPPSSLPKASPTAAAANSNGRADSMSPLRYSTSRRRGHGGDGGFGVGGPKRGPPTTAAVADPRIPMEDFESCGGGNFAICLALRWVGNSNGSSSGSSGDESGFEMLVRLALGEAHHCVLGSFTYWRSGTEQPSRRVWTGVAGNDKNVRRPSVRIWDRPRRSSNSFFSSPGVGGGVGSGRAHPSAAVMGGHHISSLITGILTENFLPQVRTCFIHWLLTGVVLLMPPPPQPSVCRHEPRSKESPRARQASETSRELLCMNTTQLGVGVSWQGIDSGREQMRKGLKIMPANGQPNEGRRARNEPLC